VTRLPDDAQDLLFPEDRPPDPMLRGGEIASLAADLPAGVRLGTSSWTFPGWTSILWSERAGRSETTLAREGLPEYVASPLLRTVGLDRGFYRPITTSQAESLAKQAGAGFRFLVKAYRGLTHLSTPDVRFLDGSYATDVVIAPLLEGLGETFGTLLFQFPEMRVRDRDVTRFLARLDAFLGELPAGPPYAVEIRDRALLSRSLATVLRDHGVAFGHALHPALPSMDEQREALGWDGDDLAGPLRSSARTGCAESPVGRGVVPRPCRRSPRGDRHRQQQGRGIGAADLARTGTGDRRGASASQSVTVSGEAGLDRSKRPIRRRGHPSTAAP
jgi:uncharacterized protein YecE (DUF72 family)